MTPVEDYVRNAIVLRAVDGDTLEVNVDLGFSIWMRVRVRLLGIDCPEMSTNEGKLARVATERWCSTADNRVTIRTHLDKRDSFGRVLAELWSGNSSLAEHLLQNGNAIRRPA